MEAIDISNNIDLITLEYFTAPQFYNKYQGKQIVSKANKISKSDRKFYKKRIINETKKMLRNEFETPGLKEIFNKYVISLVDYFKIVDKSDILKGQYQDPSGNNEPDNSNKTLDDMLDDILDISSNDFLTSPDELLYKTTNEAKKVTLDNFVVKHSIPKEKINFPEQKSIDLKEPSLKTKGIKPKQNRLKTSVKKENIDEI